MRTALLVLPAGPGPDAPGPGPTAVVDLIEQLRATGLERIGVLGPRGTDPAPYAAADVDVLEAETPLEQLEVVRSFGAGATSLDLLPADLVAHRGALEQVLVPPGAGVAALVDERPLEAGGSAVTLDDDGRVADLGWAGEDVASGWFCGVLHVGPGAVTQLGDTLDRLRAAWSREVANAASGGVAAPRDVHEQLLVALVRSGVPVAAVPVGGFVVRRPSTAAEVEAARRAITATDEERVRLARAVKARDGFFTTYLVSPYSRYIARWSARRGLTPNQVSVIALVVGLAAAACFGVGTFGWMVAGAVLLQAAFTLDCVDGQLARYSRTFSPFGAWLDAVFDRAKEFAVYAGLAVGAARTTGDRTVWWLAGAALAFQTFRHHLDFAFAVHREASIPAREPRPVRPSDLIVSSSSTAPGPGSPTADQAAGPQPADQLGLLRAARSLDAVPAARWFKAIIILPIGERFALISLGAVVLGARGTFVALLGWGAVAAAYLATGRLLRTVRT